MLFYSRELIRGINTCVYSKYPSLAIARRWGSHSEAVEPGAVVAHALLQQVLRSLYRLHRERFCLDIRYYKQCCGFGMFIPDHDFYPSRIPDPKTATKERRIKKCIVLPFFQGCGSVFIWYGSGSSILGWISIRIQYIESGSVWKWEHPALQNMKFRKFFLLWWVIFPHLPA